MSTNQLLGVTLQNNTKVSILEQIRKNIEHPSDFFHIVSLNPENLVVAQHDHQFQALLEAGNVKLADGNGIILAAKMLGLVAGERVTGVELTEELLDLAGRMRLRVLLIGGRPNLAIELANCYQKKYPEASFKGTEGIKNIHKPTDHDEEQHLKHIVADTRPQIILMSFGSPFQEKWLYNHRHELKGIICMGVGGSFDFIAGTVKRAPRWIRMLGFEWLFRLIQEPWRWKRQLRLLTFIKLVLKQKFKN